MFQSGAKRRFQTFHWGLTQRKALYNCYTTLNRLLFALTKYI
jgi:hypothetical protein